jgi:hypothetical protein
LLENSISLCLRILSCLVRKITPPPTLPHPSHSVASKGKSAQHNERTSPSSLPSSLPLPSAPLRSAPPKGTFQPPCLSLPPPASTLDIFALPPLLDAGAVTFVYFQRKGLSTQCTNSAFCLATTPTLCRCRPSRYIFRMGGRSLLQHTCLTPSRFSLCCFQVFEEHEELRKSLWKPRYTPVSFSLLLYRSTYYPQA